ncbi:MAG: hypothetical protein HOB63_14920, partial [Opitutae bacterium]|nr:hypothetical protein [Opitutae bacterium]
MPTSKTSEDGQAEPNPERVAAPNKGSSMAKSKEKTVLDLEVKDAQLIFQSVWQNLES